MNTKELVIERIRNIDNQLLLQDILHLIECETAEMLITDLTIDLKTKLDQGLDDINEGRVFPDKEAQLYIDEWFQQRK